MAVETWPNAFQRKIFHCKMGQSLGKTQMCSSNTVHKMAAAPSGSQLAQKAFHSVCIPRNPTQDRHLRDIFEVEGDQHHHI